MDNLLSVIFSSSVVVSLLGIYKWSRIKKLERITDKREIWRKDLRELAINILIANEIEEERLLLSKLKVRINTKGIRLKWDKFATLTEKNDFFNQDGYLWEIINRIENNDNITQRKKLKEKLVEAVSLLIKYDWDRSKDEITSSKIKRTNYITIFILGLTGVILFIFFMTNGYSTNFEMIGIMLLFLFLPFTLPFMNLFFDNIHKNKVNQQIYKGKSEGKISKWYGELINIKKPSALILGLVATIAIEIIAFSTIFSQYVNKTTEPILFSLEVLSLLTYLLHFISVQVFSNTREYTYYQVVEYILNDLPSIEEVSD